jgi:hypothetical protein
VYQSIYILEPTYMFFMDFFSHVLWTRVGTRNKLWDEEALLFTLLPDAGFFLIMLYVLFGKPTNLNFADAMLTLPPAFMAIYNMLHSFVILVIVALFVWKFRPKLLPALSAWALHICMDIPFHGGAMFGTRFLYPILPDFYFSGMSWGDYRVLAVSYFMLLVVWYYLEMRELKKHRNPGLNADWLDRVERSIGNQINPRPIPVGHAESGDNAGTSGQVPGEDREGPEEGQDCGAGTVPPPQAG